MKPACDNSGESIYMESDEIIADLMSVKEKTFVTCSFYFDAFVY